MCVQKISALTSVTYKHNHYYSPVSLCQKRLQSNQKKLIDLVAHGSVKKIEKLLDTGLDPNFHSDDGSEYSDSTHHVTVNLLFDFKQHICL